MKMKRHWICGLVLTLALGLACALCQAEENGDLYPEKGQLKCLLSCDGIEMELSTTLLQEEEWLFLPAFADKTALSLVFPEELAAKSLCIVSPMDKNNTLSVPEDGLVTMDWTAMASPEEDGISYVLLKDGAGQDVLTLNVMQSANLRTLFLLSDDPVNEGRLWVGDCDHHERSAPGFLLLISQKGEVDHGEKVEKIRGRGNSSWSRAYQKKPYQLTLQKKADLLDLDFNGAAAKKFTLIRPPSVSGYLTNSVAYSLAREAGIPAPHFEQVDLYYDGEYRGFYLLCEKVEVGAGRVSIANYDELIAKKNAKTDLKTLPVASGINRYGLKYTYVEGLEGTSDPTAGGYLLEVTREALLDNPCWFELPTGQAVEVKSPEYASESMMRYISEKLCHLYQTLLSGGVNPEDGALLSEELDIDAISMQAAFQELIMNKDGLRYSFYYVLDAGEDQFTMGPVWDCDYSMLRYISEGGSVYAFQNEYEHMHSLYYERLPEVQAAMAESIDRLTPLARKLISGEGDGKLESIEELYQRLLPSLRMDSRLYHAEKYQLEGWGARLEESVKDLRSLLETRLQWMTEYFHSDWQTLQLEIRAPYAVAEETLYMDSGTLFLGNITQTATEKVSEATAEEYAKYRLTILVEPAEGVHIRRVTVNGVEFPYETLEDGNLRVEGYFFEDGYRPVDYEGQDVGLIYDEAAFRANYPELSEEYGDDSEGLLDYFMEEGIYEGLKGNAFFDPHWVYLTYEDLDQFGDNWDFYYTELMEQGPAIWLDHLDMVHPLPVEPLELSEE